MVVGRLGEQKWQPWNNVLAGWNQGTNGLEQTLGQVLNKLDRFIETQGGINRNVELRLRQRTVRRRR